MVRLSGCTAKFTAGRSAPSESNGIRMSQSDSGTIYLPLSVSTYREFARWIGSGLLEDSSVDSLVGLLEDSSEDSPANLPMDSLVDSLVDSPLSSPVDSPVDRLVNSPLSPMSC